MLKTTPRHGKLLAILASLWMLLPGAAHGRQDPRPAPPQAGGATRTPPPPAAPAKDSGIISRGSAVQSGPAPDIVIFYTGEVMGWTEPCG
jgi:hypothetical protein